MAITIGKREVREAAAILDQDHDSAEAAARALLEYAVEMYERRAKFVVVGQLRNEHPGLPPDEVRGSRIVIGPFSTEGVARAAGESLSIGRPTEEEMRWWLLDMWHDTPHAFYKQRAEKAKAKAKKEEPGTLAELQKRIDWFKEHPDSLTYDIETRSWRAKDPALEVPAWLTAELH